MDGVNQMSNYQPLSDEEETRLIKQLTPEEHLALLYLLDEMDAMEAQGMKPAVIRLQATLMYQTPPAKARWN